MKPVSLAEKFSAQSPDDPRFLRRKIESSVSYLEIEKFVVRPTEVVMIEHDESLEGIFEAAFTLMPFDS
jgi:hypothetical protein